MKTSVDVPRETTLPREENQRVTGSPFVGKRKLSDLAIEDDDDTDREESKVLSVLCKHQTDVVAPPLETSQPVLTSVDGPAAPLRAAQDALTRLAAGELWGSPPAGEVEVANAVS